MWIFIKTPETWYILKRGNVINSLINVKKKSLKKVTH